MLNNKHLKRSFALHMKLKSKRKCSTKFSNILNKLSCPYRWLGDPQATLNGEMNEKEGKYGGGEQVLDIEMVRETPLLDETRTEVLPGTGTNKVQLYTCRSRASVLII